MIPTTHLSSAWRNLVRNRMYTILNILGLSLSIGIAIVIFMIIRFEHSFDTWHTNSPRIYQLLGTDKFDGLNSHIPQGAIRALKDKVPGVEKAVNVLQYTPSVIKVKEQNLEQDKTYFASPDLFDIIDVQWIEGSPQASLGQPYQVVLDEPTAIRLFKSTTQAMGQSIRYENTLDLTVTGIIKAMPPNTQFRMGMILSYASLLKYMDWYKDENYWSGGDSHFQGFVLLKPGVQPASIVTALNKEAAARKDQASIINYQLVRLSDQHFNANPEIDFFNYAMPRWLLYTLTCIGIFLLMIACINFVNMATVQAMQRNKATGIRKILGGSRASLIGQFLLETGLVVTAALAGGALLAYVLLPFTGELLQTQVAQWDPWRSDLLLFLGITGLVLTLLSGIYPAIMLSGFKPVNMLRTQVFGMPGKGFSLRRLLVVTQFTIALILVICTLIGVKQLNYFQHKDLGFDKASVIRIPMPEARSQLLRERLRRGLQQSTAIRDVTFGLTTPSGTTNWWWANVKHYGLKDGEQQFRQQFVDTNYLSFYKIPLVAGRSFTIADSNQAIVLINEKGARDMGITDPAKALGQQVTLWKDTYTIAGVVKDYQSQSLQWGTTPHIFMYNGRFFNASIRIDPVQQEAALQLVEKEWKALFPDYYFKYEFLDDNLKSFYSDETKLARFLSLFSIIGILIGCLGVYGLVAYVCMRKTKEIGVRKVLGAGFMDIMGLLNKEFVWLIGISFVIAAPIAGITMHHFLQDYVHRIPMSWWIFLLSGAGALLVTLLTISFQATRAAIANPVKSLRNE
ncbi:ABC transporter permease [Paraflavitalea sp. CAU 1676]|uniref:ABC transporter permease n=1 Tax=Paraflavitalea sp. CAU 1676 TaxID=3032598 RepID=UPI0023DA96BB|nr:ABC transporter permease [Paraflavitalea sp. CAU 1676]MDF2192016.1 ABC transporter permease [Paraflavitalea sp. CAU 1676]